MKKRTIAIDFDGTIMTYTKFPEIGNPNGIAIEVMTELQEAGHKIILHTVRDEDSVQPAIEYLEENGIVLYGVNDNKQQKHFSKSRKVFAHLYIDDAALGVPLINNPEVSDRPFVNWYEVRRLLVKLGYLEN